MPNGVVNKIYHIEVDFGKLSFDKGKNENSSYYKLFIPIKSWLLVELLSAILVLGVILRERRGNYSLINFHIAYPNLTYFKYIKKWIKTPLLITEHWSAYHFQFNVKDISKLKRIQNIFHHNIPVIGVSGALLEDIKKFSGASFPAYVVPNVVDTAIFLKDDSIQRNENEFLMVSQWKWPKDPLTVIRAWKEIVNKNPSLKLRIGGYGPQWEEMKTLVKDLKLEDQITFLGTLNPKEIAGEMQKACAFIHCSEYETFSVVCAEALCCGTPVIASKVGGIQEFVNHKNGVLFENKEKAKLSEIIQTFNEKMFDEKEIANRAKEKFSSDSVGNKYFEVIKKVIAETNQ